jgi:hypothetical protein
MLVAGGAVLVSLSMALYAILVCASVKRQLVRYKKGVNQELGVATESLREAVEVLNRRLGEVERHSEGLVPPLPTQSGLNLSKRALAIRLFRRGETPEHAAAALGLPHGEMVLLWKVLKATAN